jgi:hypothetical protein
MPFIIPEDVTYTGGGGLQFGEIYAENNAVATTVSAAGTWYQITIFTTNGDSNGDTTPDYTNDHITVGKAGKYLVLVSASILSGGGLGFVLEGHIETNNGGTSYDNIHFDRNLAGGGGDTGSISMSGIADLAANDTVEVWMRNKTNTTNFTVEDINLTVLQIGGT